MENNLINEEQYLYCSDKPGPGTYYRKIKHETVQEIKNTYSKLPEIVIMWRNIVNPTPHELNRGMNSGAKVYPA